MLISLNGCRFSKRSEMGGGDGLACNAWSYYIAAGTEMVTVILCQAVHFTGVSWRYITDSSSLAGQWYLPTSGESHSGGTAIKKSFHLKGMEPEKSLRCGNLFFQRITPHMCIVNICAPTKAEKNTGHSAGVKARSKNIVVYCVSLNRWTCC